ncbi:MAG: hypothetical protein K6A28_07380 [Bacteroidales bacterium]|nr:hypothetical protein [Bacteroidales bacterium]
MKRLILTIGLLLGLFGMACAQDVEVSAKVQNESVAVGKPFSLDLMMKVPYGYYVEWNGFAADTLSEQIDILKRGDLQRTADADSNTIVQQELTLMTFDTGYVEVPRVGLTYARSADDPMRMQAFTDPIQLHVTTITVDTIQPFRPLVEPIAKPVTMKEVFPWILGALLLVLVILGLWFFLKNRKPKVDENGEPVKGPVKPPYNKAIDDLATLKQQKLWQVGKVKEYYSSLSDIAREYIEGQFEVNAVEMTTDDILQEVRDLDFSPEVFGKLKGSMELSDLVKFAKYDPSSLENDNAMADMTDFVNDSYNQYQERLAREAAETGKEAQGHV